MKYYFAPMEGLTDSIYRRLHAHYFPGVHRYYTPFFSPTVHRFLTAREERELAISPAHHTIPQVLTKNPDDFLWFSRVCMERGYSEINLNLGCPSGTVVSKGKGAGLLRDPDVLKLFLDRIFTDSPLPISIKMRIGLESPDEFPGLLAIINTYPVAELILHPRVRKAYYSGPVNMEAFSYAERCSRLPLCYNGDLCCLEDISEAVCHFPKLNAIMIGRGLIGDPGMLSPGGASRETLAAFCDDLLEEYLFAFGGSRNAMFRMKENWRYLLCRFDSAEKLGKQLRKTTDLQEYRRLTHEILFTLPLLPKLAPDWRSSTDKTL